MIDLHVLLVSGILQSDSDISIYLYQRISFSDYFHL